MITAGLGLAGGQVSAGVAWQYASADFGGPGAESTLRLQATLLRTWASPRYLNSHQTYAGAELTATVPMLLGVRVGAFRLLRAEPAAPKTIVTFGILIGWL
jgi:hypothetical protein